MKTFDPKELENKVPKEFWDERYTPNLSRVRGKAGRFLQQELSKLDPKRVLELGCSTGDDSLWLAEQGWQVTAVDISDVATQIGQRLAEEAGLADKIDFLACDLATEFPEGEFELVCALYFQSPFESFPRARILQQAASRIVSGGHLLVVTHASAAPWSMQQHPDFVFPTLEADWAELKLSEDQWQIENLSVQSRLAKGPEGQEAEVKDNLIFVRRR